MRELEPKTWCPHSACFEGFTSAQFYFNPMDSMPFIAAGHLQIWFNLKGIQITHSGPVRLQDTSELRGLWCQLSLSQFVADSHY